MNQIDLGRAFKAYFNDKDWPMKTLLGFLWQLLFVTAPAVTGAQIEYITRVTRGDESLPEWDDFGGKWVTGLLVWVAVFIYFLPVVILSFIFIAPVMIAAISSGDTQNVAGAIAGTGLCLFWIIAIIYSVAVSILLSAATVNFAMKRTFGAMFEFGEILAKVRGNTGYFTAWLFTIVIAILGSTVTSALSATGVGVILYPAVTFFTVMISGHILGQWAARAYGVAPHMPSGAGYPPPPPAYTPPSMTPQPPAPQAPPAEPGTGQGQSDA